jgi:hypothetical protein
MSQLRQDLEAHPSAQALALAVQLIIDRSRTAK